MPPALDYHPMLGTLLDAHEQWIDEVFAWALIGEGLVLLLRRVTGNPRLLVTVSEIVWFFSPFRLGPLPVGLLPGLAVTGYLWRHFQRRPY